MKVALISPLPPPEGGIATWTKEVESYFIDNQIQYEIINNSVVGKRSKQITSSTNIYDEIIRTRRIMKRLKTVLENFKPDILHINTSCGRFGIFRDYICMRIAKKNRIPCILHCHCNVKDQIHNSFSEYIFTQMVQMAKEILVLNRETFSYVSSKKNCNITLMPNFIRMENVRTSHKKIRKEIQKILYVGHVQRTKGCFEIIKTAKQFQSIEFVMVGPISDEFGELELPSNVNLVGREQHEKIKKYMEEADLFLFPSYTEGFSNALLEAMSVGLPIIASNVGANADMIEENGGVIVPVRDVQAIVDAIISLNNPEIRERMSIWNINKVVNCYSKNSVMEKLIEVYCS